MPCNCFENAQKKVREITGDPHAIIRSVFTDINGKLYRLPSIEVLYHKKKKDGSFYRNQSEIDLTYQYCPFCGKKIIEDDLPSKE
jgi:hypothetical protein|nr:MAG TPA: 30S ribosomal protein S11 [Caudoviricetes sp.]